MWTQKYITLSSPQSDTKENTPLFFTIFEGTMCFLVIFKRNTLKRNLTYSCFIFPLFHDYSFSPELLRAARLPKTSCFEKITVCVIETMLMTLPLVQMNKARREVNQQIKHRSMLNKKSRQFLKL